MHTNERDRLAKLHSLNLLDTPVRSSDVHYRQVFLRWNIFPIAKLLHCLLLRMKRFIVRKAMVVTRCGKPKMTDNSMEKFQLLMLDLPSEKALSTFIKKLNEGTSHEKITIYKNMFIEAKNPISLLALMGMHNTGITGIFRFQIQKLVAPCIEEELACQRDKLIELVNNELKCISGSIVS